MNFIAKIDVKLKYLCTPDQSVKSSGPGLFCIIPCTDTFRLVDKRTISFDIPAQEILTKDNVTVTVNGVVFYRVVDSNASIIQVENASMSTHLLAQTTLRNTLGINYYMQ